MRRDFKKRNRKGRKRQIGREKMTIDCVSAIINNERLYVGAILPFEWQCDERDGFLSLHISSYISCQMEFNLLTLILNSSRFI
eukprot:m.57314 g.57314  ORF g.57314 m.57314 type:complete len:83 (-) comp7824_c1_seq8:3510-3758(-)